MKDFLEDGGGFCASVWPKKEDMHKKRSMAVRVRSIERVYTNAGKSALAVRLGGWQ